MTLVVRAHGGASSIGHNFVDPSKEEFTMVPQDKDVIPREYRGGASRPGCNSTKATWWCLL